MNEIESAIVYRLLSIKGVGRATANKLLGRLAGNGSRLADLVADSCNSSALNGLLNREQIGQLFIAKDRIADQVQKVIADEGGFLTWADERYPKQLIETLRDNAPPILSYKGNLNLLASRSVGFCGSRKASERGLETARDCAEQIASTDIAIVSGNAAGVDTAAHFTALNSNGSTIIVLPEGILRFRIRSDLRKVWDWSRVLVISEFEPGITWNSGNAMQRNLTIIGLSDVMIVVEAGEEGGAMGCGILLQFIVACPKAPLGIKF